MHGHRLKLLWDAACGPAEFRSLTYSGGGGDLSQCFYGGKVIMNCAACSLVGSNHQRQY
jgi:hypothetical protein